MASLASLWLIANSLHRDLRISATSTLQTTAFIAMSYGFWRYSVEVEAYAIAIFLSFLTVHLALRWQQKWHLALPVALLGALSCLIHIMCAFTVFVVVPLCLLGNRRLKFVSIYVFVSVVLILFTYGLCDSFPAPINVLSGNLLDLHATLSQLFSSITKSVMAFGSSIVAPNFLFGFEWVRSMLATSFGDRNIQEELYMGLHAPRILVLLGSLTLTVSLLMLVYAITAVTKSFKIQNRWLFIAGMSGFLGYSAVVMKVEGSNPELWVMSIPLLGLVIASLLSSEISKAFGLFLVALMAHNAVGGFGMLQSKQGDYNQARAKWFLHNMTAEDMVVTTQNVVTYRYFRYILGKNIHYLTERKSRSGDEITFIDVAGAGETVEIIRNIKGRVFVWPEAVPLVEKLFSTVDSKGGDANSEVLKSIRVVVAESFPVYELQTEQLKDR